jgi:hypothetical protein
MDYTTLKTEVNLSKKDNIISNVFPQGQFSDNRTNPFKSGESTRKIYLDKFNNPKDKIRVISYKNNMNNPTSEINKVFSDNSNYKPNKHIRVKYSRY